MNRQSTPIKRRSLHEEIVERIRDMILTGELPSGARISEQTLCARFGVSRTPLREALKLLSSEGFLILTPNRGATVSGLSERDMREAFPIMGALEALAGELACANATKDQIDDIAAMTEAMADCHARGELEGYFKLNQRIHLAIAAAADNPTLERMQRSLDGRVRRGRYQANMSRARWDEAMAEHVEIARALTQRDGRRVAMLLRTHLANKLASLKATLTEVDQTSEGNGAAG